MCRSLFVFLVAVAGCTRPASPVATPPVATGPTLTYLGVAGWSLSSPKGTLLFDPYFTRTALTDDSQPMIPNEALIDVYAPVRAEAILVGHSHYDHLLDVPSIARRTGGLVIGTSSTAHVALASGVSTEKVRVVSGGESLDVGPFHVRVVAGLHSLTGQPNVPIPSGVTVPLSSAGYAEGGTLQYLVGFEGRTIFFVGTANFIDGNVTGLRPDVAVVAVGRRDKIPDYTCRLMRALGSPALVLPNHFDEFRQPLRPGQTYDQGTLADLDAFAAEVHACAPASRVEVPLAMKRIRLTSPAAK